jgi:hypothetical protein
MKKVTCLCDMCAEDGFSALAEGQYDDCAGRLVEVCSVHLKKAEAQGFEITARYETPGNVEFPEY